MADDQFSAAEKFEEKKQATSAIKSFLSGGFGGVSAVLVGHPFDLTKTRLQTAAPGVYTGGLDVVKKTLAKDGIKGMYRGMGPPLVGVTPIFALSFWSYDTGKKIVYAMTPDRKDPKLSYSELAFAGFFSAVPTTLVAGPAERVKVLLQLQGQGGSGPQYSGPVDVVKHGTTIAARAFLLLHQDAGRVIPRCAGVASCNSIPGEREAHGYVQPGTGRTGLAQRVPGALG